MFTEVSTLLTAYSGVRRVTLSRFLDKKPLGQEPHGCCGTGMQAYKWHKYALGVHVLQKKRERQKKQSIVPPGDISYSTSTLNNSTLIVFYSFSVVYAKTGYAK